MENRDLPPLEISEEEIKENFKLLTRRPITERTVSVGKCIGRIAQWRVIDILKLSLLPLRSGNYYLIKAEVLEELFRKLDKNSIDQAREEQDRTKTEGGNKG